MLSRKPVRLSLWPKVPTYVPNFFRNYVNIAGSPKIFGVFLHVNTKYLLVVYIFTVATSVFGTLLSQYSVANNMCKA